MWSVRNLTEMIPHTNNHTKEHKKGELLFLNNQYLPSLVTLLILMAAILYFPLSNLNVKADFLHQDTMSDTTALLILLGAEKQTLF